MTDQPAGMWRIIAAKFAYLLAREARPLATFKEWEADAARMIAHAVEVENERNHQGGTDRD